MTANASARLRALGATAATLALVALGLAAPLGAQADDDVTWTVRTASNSFGADRTSYSYAVEPGATVDDAMVIANRGAEPLDLGVYAADGYTTRSGQFDVVVGGAKSVGVGAWVHGSSSRVSVAPGATVELPFSVRVPRNATPGDYAGGIVTSLVQPDQQQGINVDRRLGIRIALRVGGDLKPGVAIEDQQISWNGGLNPFAGGDATLSYTIHNTGNAVLSAQQAPTAAGPFGLFAAKAPRIGSSPQLLPGERWKVSVPFHDVAATFWLTGTASLTPIVRDASGSSSALGPVTATAVGPAVPWMLILILVVLAALVVVTLHLRRRLAARRKEHEDARVQEAVELALAGKGSDAS